MKETGFSRWTCDRPGCSSIKFCLEDTPEGWWRDEAARIFCSKPCLDTCHKPWYDDPELVVKVTLADVVKGSLLGNPRGLGQVQLGINAATECGTKQPFRDLKIFTETGIARKRNTPGDSPDSIVRLIPPSFAEACEHPAEFVAMRNAARAEHQQLSDQEAWNALARQMYEIYLAVDKMVTSA